MTHDHRRDAEGSQVSVRSRRLLTWIIGAALAVPTLATACGTSGDGDTGPAGSTAGDLMPVIDSTPWPTDPDEIDPGAPARWEVEIVERFPHDPTAFTQGLEVLDDDLLLESTGLRGQSSIRIINRDDGSVERREPLDDTHFGEGLTTVDGVVVQLTWQAGVAYRWRLPDLEPLAPFRFDGEGWGICALDGRLVTSDGSATLTWRDPVSFEPLETIDVRRRGAPVERLNELECMHGHIVANVWLEDYLVVVRPDGTVAATIDGRPLGAEISSSDPDAVLNGVADLGDGTLLLGGKRWPTFFRVRLVSP